MSRQEQNDRHIIWSDISLDLDDWRESLEELYPGYSDDELYDIMVKSNAENIYDERVNLNIQLSQPIIVIGDLGRWNGRVSGYKMIDSGNIKDCLYSDTDYTEWYVDKYGDLRADAVHHDDEFLHESKRLFNSVQHIEIFIGLLCRLTKEKATILNRKENQRIVDMLVDLWMKLMKRTPEITQT